jgi:methyl-accepting chemotaxis protein-2 (aspartate sensor receptor)
VNGDFRSNRLLLILITLFSVAVGSLIGWFIVRSITRPLGQAVNIAQSIADGDLTGSIASHGKDETGQLLTALMEMKNRLLEIVQQVQTGSENISALRRRLWRVTRIWPHARKSRPARWNRRRSMEQITATVKNTASHR